MVCLFFAKSREIAGVADKEFNIPEGMNKGRDYIRVSHPTYSYLSSTGTTSLQFIDILLADLPALRDILQVSLLAVNLEYLERGM